MNENQILTIVERYSRKGNVKDDDIKVTRVADRKTVFVEQSGVSGQAIVMKEYKVDGAIYWAGYSWRSQTVYINHAA